MPEKKIRVKVSRTFEYTHDELMTHPVSARFLTWDIASDRQRAQHAAVYDMGQILAKRARIIKRMDVEILPDE